LNRVAIEGNDKERKGELQGRGKRRKRERKVRTKGELGQKRDFLNSIISEFFGAKHRRDKCLCCSRLAERKTVEELFELV
jgi:hypothetical protein